jgi:hypothetical protein
MAFNFNYELRITNYDLTNVDSEKSEIKPQLVTGGIYLITGRFLATVGGWGTKIKWQNNFTISLFHHFTFASRTS